MANNVAITPGSGASIATDEVTDATLGTVQVQYLKLMDGTNDGTNKAIVGATGALKTDGSAFTQPVSGTIAATQSGNWTARLVGNAGGIIDFASTQNVASPASAILVGAEFNTTPATISNGNVSPLQLDDTGCLKVTTNFATNNVTQGSVPWQVASDVSHATSDSGAPIKVGGQARITNPTAVTDAQRVNAIFDKLGKQITVGAVRALMAVQTTSITGAGETTVVTAGAAGVFNDVYGIVCSNTSATAVNVAFKDATTGTTRVTLMVPAGDVRGLMLPVDSAIPQATTAANWTATVSSAVTSILITMLYVKNI